MDYLLLNEAKKNNDLISFRKKDADGLELIYAGHVTDLNDKDFEFNSIYGKSYCFKIKEIIDLKGPTNTYMDHAMNTYPTDRPLRKYIIFDTETTGLPKKWDAPVSDTDNWPRVIQFAWSIHTEDGKEIEHADLIVKPEGFFIPLETSKIHGITTEKAMEMGIPLKDALDQFAKAVEKSDYLVAHNISFDEMVIGSEYYREKLNDPILGKNKICTKEASVDYCKIPGRGGRYSWASLNDLYAILFNSTFENAHNASNDVKACARCFFELKRLGVIQS